MLLLLVLNLLLMVVVLVEISHRTHSSMKICPHRQSEHICFLLSHIHSGIQMGTLLLGCNIDCRPMCSHRDMYLETQKGVTVFLCNVTVIHTEIIDSVMQHLTKTTKRKCLRYIIQIETVVCTSVINTPHISICVPIPANNSNMIQ